MHWTPAGHAPGTGSRLDGLVVAATVAGIVSIVFRTFIEPDVWWHVAIGRDILAQWAVPRLDQYAAAAWGRPYHDSHWLFQVVLAIADRMGQMEAVGLFTGALWSATLLLCYLAIRRWATTAMSCLLIFIVGMACSNRFIPRPDIVTCLMIALFYLRLQAGRYATLRDLAVLALMQVVWSNSHGLFVIGPFMAGCYVVPDLVRYGRGREANLKPTLRLVAVLLLATLCTPFGLEGWRYALLLAYEAVAPDAPLIFKTLHELVPTFSATMVRQPDFWAFMVLLIAVLGSAVAVMMMKRDVPYPRLLIVLVLLLVASSGRRNMALAALTAAPLIAENLSLVSFRMAFPPAARWALAISLVVFSWMPVSGRYYDWFNYKPWRFGVGVRPSDMPTEFPAFLRQSGFSGQIYNNDLFGGFCLYNGILPLVDGRWEVYDRDDLNRIMSAPYQKEAWDWMLNRYNIQGLFMVNGEEATGMIVARLLRERTFQLVYTDEVSNFWVRVQ